MHTRNLTSKYTYETIKAVAAQIGVKVNDLLALSPQNDPFYAGTPTDQLQAEWFARIWNKAGYTSGTHLRRVHYWTVSQNPPVIMHTGEAYENTEKCWKYLTQAAKMARYLKLVRIEDIADHKNPAPYIGAYYYSNEPDYEIDAPELTSPQINVYGIHNSLAQPYHLEIWCEKSTMNDVLEPICQQYGANLATFQGEVSITACYQLMQRIQASRGKPTRIFYISDFDPAGNSMPAATARKIEFMLSHFGLSFEVKLKPIVLTPAQVAAYKLPRTPIKDTEKRAAKFEDNFGQGAVELDALEAIYPGELSQLVTAEVSRFWSADANRLARTNAQALHDLVSQQVEEITSRYAVEIEALQKMLDELRNVDIDPEPYRIEPLEAEADEQPDEWLFDSNRDYVNQISYYKLHKSGQS